MTSPYVCLPCNARASINGGDGKSCTRDGVKGYLIFNEERASVPGWRQVRRAGAMVSP